jgi:hypothetical protein
MIRFIAFSAMLLSLGAVAKHGGGGGGGGKSAKMPRCVIAAPGEDPIRIEPGEPVAFIGSVENGTAPSAFVRDLPGSNLNQVGDTIASSGGTSVVPPSYGVAGTFNATLTAIDAQGNNCGDARTVEVSSEPPLPVAANAFSVLAANHPGMRFHEQ